MIQVVTVVIEMEASSGKQVGENSTDEQGYETSTKTDPNYWSVIASDCIDAGYASDQLAGLTENFSHQLTVGELEAETSESEHASSRPISSGGLPPEGMFREDPRPVSTKGASSMKIPISHSMDPPNHPAVRVVCQGNRVIAMQQENGKPAENTEYQDHSFPVGFGGQQTAVNPESEEITKAREVYCENLEKKNKELNKELNKKATKLQALETKIEFLEKHKEEFEKRNVEESKKVIKLKQQLNLRKIKYKEVKGKLAQKVKEGNEIEKRKNEVHKENSTLLQNASFLTEELRKKTEAFDWLSRQYEQVQQQFSEVLDNLRDAQTSRDQFKQLLEESGTRELEKNESIRKLLEHIEEQDQKTLDGGEVIQFVTVELNRRREEYQKRMQEEALQAFSQAETNAVKKLKRMLAKEKQRVKSLKRSIAVEKTNRERRIKERNKNLCKRNRQLRARVNNLSPKDLRDFSSVGTSRCCQARNDEQSWSTRNRQLWARVKKLKMKDGINSTSAGTVMCCEASDDQQSWSSDSDEEETVGHQPERRPSGI